MFKSFITPTHAKQCLSTDSNTKLLFTTLESMSANKPDDIKALDRPCYIPNSILFDFNNSICDKTSKLSNMMPSASQFDHQVGELGLSNENTVFVYDDFGNFCASRVWFMFMSMGFNNIKVIDGGLPAWLDMGFNISTKLSPQTTAANFFSKHSSRFRFVDAEYVESQIGSKKTCIIDARGQSRFLGKVVEKRAYLRSGHIPTSKNLPYVDLQLRSGTRSMPELIKKFSEYLDKKELIFSCGSGVTACILAQCAFEVFSSSTNHDMPILSVYDGSWSEWGAESKFDIEI